MVNGNCGYPKLTLTKFWITNGKFFRKARNKTILEFIIVKYLLGFEPLE